MSVTLRDVFTPLITYVLLFVRTAGAQRRPFSDLRTALQRLLDEEALVVKRNDVAEKDYDAARFAVVAWADEIILRSTHETNRETSQQWKRSPLQVELYNTANAGEEFFERVEQLTPAQKEIKEIYHLCLCLGFRGRYYDDSQEYKLVELRRKLAQQLPNPPADLLDLEKRGERVTPQPYDVAAPPAWRPPHSYATLWAALTAAVFAGVLLWWLWPRGRSAPEVVADVKEHLEAFTCCRVAVTGFDPDSGTVQLAGRVDGDEQSAAIRKAAMQVEEVSTVQDAFQVVPRPFCEVVDLLDPLRRGAGTNGAGVAVHPQKNCDAVYYRGENLVFDVAAKQPLQRVYVDYYVADRKYVAHLLPNPSNSDNQAGSATSLRIGEPGTEPRWKVEPPFGMELITVVSSPQPLFDELRETAEPAATYIDELRRVLPAEGASTELTANYCFITTEDR